jgi:hypothetical protein
MWDDEPYSTEGLSILGGKNSEQSVLCIMEWKDMNVPVPGKIFSIPITLTIHPFPKHLRFSWLGVYSRFACKAVIFDNGMDNPSTLILRRGFR